MSMAESGRRRGETTREAILEAAEIVFAEHGFDGARVETIANASGYDKKLIFHYFGDKLGLYAQVLKRIDRQWSGLQARLLELLFEDETLASDAHRLRTFLKTALGAFFDYLIEHPRLMRISIWEHAQGWQTYAKIASQFQPAALTQVEALFSQARRAGLLRSDFDPVVLLLLAEQVCWLYPTSLPFYQMVLPDKDFSSAESRARTREHLIEFLVAGMLVDPKDDEV
jgi:AcrR family transcriptional regulator